MGRHFLIVMLSLMVFALAGCAGERPLKGAVEEQPLRPDGRVSRVYDVRDLLFSTNFWPKVRAAVPVPITSPKATAALYGNARDKSYVEQLRRLIQVVGSIALLSEEMAGRQSDQYITELNATLTIPTTPENHQRVNLLLAYLRHPRRHPAPLFTDHVGDPEVFVETRVYDVQDILLDLTFKRCLNPSSNSRPVNFCATVWVDPDTLPKPYDVRNALYGVSNSLMQLIANNAGDPIEWTLNGGIANEPGCYDNALVVRATPAVHREVQALLDSLRHPIR
jgi:hypothetical protein